jgi:putative hydrolase of the HAD superfamily
VDAHNLDPAETLFIDDSPQHLKTADSLGMQTHLLTSEETLEGFMYGAGVFEKE